MGTQGSRTRGFNSVKGAVNPLSGSNQANPFKPKDGNFVEGAAGQDDYGESKNRQQVAIRGKSQGSGRGTQMNPKVLETWINETL